MYHSWRHLPPAHPKPGLRNPSNLYQPAMATTEPAGDERHSKIALLLKQLCRSAQRLTASQHRQKRLFRSHRLSIAPAPRRHPLRCCSPVHWCRLRSSSPRRPKNLQTSLGPKTHQRRSSSVILHGSPSRHAPGPPRSHLLMRSLARMAVKSHSNSTWPMEFSHHQYCMQRAKPDLLFPREVQLILKNFSIGSFN